MEDTATSPALTYTLPTWQRFLFAFLIGLPTSMMFAFVGIATPFWWLPEFPIMVLLFAFLFSIVRDPAVTAGFIGPKRARSAMLTAGLIVLGYFMAELVLFRLPSLFAYLGFVVIPIAVGVVAGFVLSGGRTRRFAWLCGVFAWLGAAILNLVATVYNAYAYGQTAEFAQLLKAHKLPAGTTGATLANVQLLVGSMVHLTGIALSLLGAEFGWRLRKRLLSQDAVSARG